MRTTRPLSTTSQAGPRWLAALPAVLAFGALIWAGPMALAAVT